MCSFLVSFFFFFFQKTVNNSSFACQITVFILQQRKNEDIIVQIQLFEFSKKSQNKHSVIVV